MGLAGHDLQTRGLGFQFPAHVLFFKFYAELVILFKGFRFFMVGTHALIDFAVVIDDLLGPLLNPV